MHCRYYLNGVDAFRLKLLLPLTQQQQDEIAARELERLSLSNGGNAAAFVSFDGNTISDIPALLLPPLHNIHTGL